MRKRLTLLTLFLFSLIILGFINSYKASAAETDPPTLSKPFFDGNGTFSVFYSDPNQKPPVKIFVKVPAPVGTSKVDYPLEAVGFGPAYSDTYRTTAYLYKGSYTYQFFANNGTLDAIKATEAPDLGITQEATFQLDHKVPEANSSDGSGGCSLYQYHSNSFKISSFLFLMSIGFLFLRGKKLVSDSNR